MATQFGMVGPQKAAAMLRQAADLVNAAMIWATTPEERNEDLIDPDHGKYWQGVRNRLLERAMEAEEQGKENTKASAPTQQVKQPVSAPTDLEARFAALKAELAAK